MLAFGSTLGALRFAQAAQVALMFARWPPGVREIFGPTQAAPDGRLLYAGPRIAMALHSTDNHRQVAGPAPTVIIVICHPMGTKS